MASSVLKYNLKRVFKQISIQFFEIQLINQSLYMSIFNPQKKSKAFSFVKAQNPDQFETPQRKTSFDQQSTSKSENKCMLPFVDPPLLQLELPKQSGCSCRKSMCLKMYCQCFAKGKMCNDSCLCQGCRNKSDNMKRSEVINELITKDPFVFSRKDYKQQYFDGDACNCRKSKCQKKYCDCFRLGRKCTEKCNCVGCENFIQDQIKFQTYEIGKKKVKFV